MPLRKLFLSTALAISLAGADAVAQGANVTLNVDQMRQLAADTMAAQQWAEARALAEALLARDPGDLTALTILATTAFQMGDMPTAREAAAAIYRSGADQRRRYEAARLAGLSAANEERFGLGEIWLRRALTVAPTEDDFRQTVRDASNLSRLNPWNTSVQFSFAPSDNLNGGATEAEILVDGQPLIDPAFGLAAGVIDENRAVSGWAYTLDTSLRYRLPTSNDTARTTIGLRGYGRGVILSQESKDFLDGTTSFSGDQIDASYYSTALVDVSIYHDHVVGPGTISLAANAGRAWARTETNYDYLRLTAARGEIISPQDKLSFSATVERRFDTFSSDIQSDRMILSAAWQHQLANRDTLSFSANGTKINSDSPTVRGTNWGVGASYRMAAPVGPATLSGSVSMNWAEFPDFGIGFSAIPRSDKNIRASLEMTFESLSYAGFFPVVIATGERRFSNINQYEGEALGLEFGLRSTF